MFRLEADIFRAVQTLLKHDYELSGNISVSLGSKQMTRKGGYCKYFNSGYLCEIRLSPLFLDFHDWEGEAVFGMILHELGHAWFGGRKMYSEHHGPSFQRMAGDVGFPMHCDWFAVPKFVVFCPDCGGEWFRYKECKITKWARLYTCECGSSLKVREGTKEDLENRINEYLGKEE